MALDVLRTYFIELPLLTNSSVSNLREAVAIEIDRQVETQISGIQNNNFPLKHTPEERIREQENNFNKLYKLTATPRKQS